MLVLKRARHSWIQQWLSLSANPAVAECIEKTVNGDELSIKEGIIMESYVSSAFNSYSNQFMHSKIGLGVNDWIKTREVIGDFVSIPWIQKWWREYGELRFEDVFVNEINSILIGNLGSADYMKKIVENTSDNSK